MAAMEPYTVNMTGPVYVGLAVCSRDANGLPLRGGYALQLPI